MARATATRGGSSKMPRACWDLAFCFTFLASLTLVASSSNADLQQYAPKLVTAVVAPVISAFYNNGIRARVRVCVCIWLIEQTDQMYN